MENKKVLKIGLPKGSLQEATFALFKKAGYQIGVSSRSYVPYVDDERFELVLLRAQEMSRYVEDGFLDCGITGEDWILENRSDVVRIVELIYGKQTTRPVRWVFAVRNDSPIQTITDLQGKRIATELVQVTKDFLKKNTITATVEYSWGATEVKVRSGLVDAIVELTETGSSLRANGLREVLTVCESTTKFIANKKSWEDSDKRVMMENLAILLKGALEAEKKVGLKMNIAKDSVDSLLKMLPALKNPTISPLADAAWVAVETIIDESVVQKILPELKRIGAQGIIEYPLNKVIY